METTLELLSRALEKKTQTAWAKDMGIAPTSLASAKHRGHLSPALAGLLANELGENPVKWIVIAALEQESGGNGRGKPLAHLKKVAEAVSSDPVNLGKPITRKRPKKSPQ